MDFRFDTIYKYRWMFLYDVLTTLGLTVIATTGGSVLGLLLALVRLINPKKADALVRVLAWVLRRISFWYVALFRGMPLFVRIVVWAYAWLPFFVHPADSVLIDDEAAVDLHRPYGALVAGSLALVVSSGAYICETFHTGVQSIGKGQMETARSLGLTYAQAMCYMILPQALCHTLPSLANEFITLLKDSPLLSVTGVAESAHVQSTITGRYSVYEGPFYTTALIYLVLTSALGQVFLRLGGHYNPQHR